MITPEVLTFYDLEMRRAIEPGWFRVFVGGSSEDVIEGRFEVVGFRVLHAPRAGGGR